MIDNLKTSQLQGRIAWATMYLSEMLCLQHLYTPLKTSTGLSDLTTRSAIRDDGPTGLPHQQTAHGGAHGAMPHLKALYNAQMTKPVSVPQGKQISAHKLHNSTYTNTPSHTLCFHALSMIFLTVLPTKLILQQHPLLPSYASPLMAPRISAPARVRMG